MAAMTCPRCKSPDIRPTTTGRVRNSHICNNCGYTFTIFNTGSLIGPVAASLIGPIAIPTLLVEGAKKLFGSGSNGNRPAPARPPPGAAATPPRPQPRGASTPQYRPGGTPHRHHPMAPVPGHPPSASPPVLGQGPLVSPGEPDRRHDPHAGSSPSGPKRRP